MRCPLSGFNDLRYSTVLEAIDLNAGLHEYLPVAASFNLSKYSAATVVRRR